ncbi:nucleotidyltransferase domain-containing protein [Candidatus Gottesmanbacteria bacterium]|nr:nucleotidyltransferase domain-containing protein [Candidatus Gottesmanbacteria bacterium]
MIDDQSLATVRSVVGKHVDLTRYKAFIFGSRTHSMHRKYADIDVGLMGPVTVPTATLLRIQEDLHNADIPYLTDVVDFSSVSQDFREKALSHIVSL